MVGAPHVTEQASDPIRPSATTLTHSEESHVLADLERGTKPATKPAEGTITKTKQKYGCTRPKSSYSLDRKKSSALGPRRSEEERSLTSPDSRFNQTLRNVQGLLKGHSIPGKILLTRRSDPLDESSLQEQYTEYERSFSYKEAGSSDCLAKAAEEEVQSISKPNNNTNVINTIPS
nr:hypothetical protein CFP56_44822 [Quercus suber]